MHVSYGTSQIPVPKGKVDTHVVSGHAVEGEKGRVTTASNVAAHNTDGLTLTTDKGNAVLVGSLVDLVGLDTSAELEGRAGVGALLIVLVELDLLEVVGPDR